MKRKVPAKKKEPAKKSKKDVDIVDAIPLRTMVPDLPAGQEEEIADPTEQNLQDEPEKTHTPPVEVESDSAEETLEKEPVKKRKAIPASVPLKGRLRKQDTIPTDPVVEKKAKPAAKKKPEPVQKKDKAPVESPDDKISESPKEKEKTPAEAPLEEKLTPMKKTKKQVKSTTPPLSKKHASEPEPSKPAPKKIVPKKSIPAKPAPKTKESASVSRTKPSEKGKAKVTDEVNSDNETEKVKVGVRQLWQERGFDDKMVDLPAYMSIPISQFEWESFCNVQPPSNVQMVQEFYENLEEIRKGRGVVTNVRGKVIIVSAEKINEYYDIAMEEEDNFQLMMDNPESEEFDVVLGVVAKKGITWTHNKDSKFLKATELTQHAECGYTL